MRVGQHFRPISPVSQHFRPARPASQDARAFKPAFLGPSLGVYLGMYAPRNVCTSACMYLGMYVPRYVCTSACMYLGMYAPRHACTPVPLIILRHRGRRGRHAALGPPEGRMGGERAYPSLAFVLVSRLCMYICTVHMHSSWSRACHVRMRVRGEEVRVRGER